MPKAGKSAAGNSPKAGMLMPGSKMTSTGTKGGPPKATTGKHGSGLIRKAKAGC